MPIPPPPSPVSLSPLRIINSALPPSRPSLPLPFVPSASTLTTRLVASGTPDDFTAEVQSAIAVRFATEVNVTVQAISVLVVAMSVEITVSISLPALQAASALSAIQARLANPATASTFLAGVGGMDIQVQSILVAPVLSNGGLQLEPAASALSGEGAGGATDGGSSASAIGAAVGVIGAVVLVLCAVLVLVVRRLMPQHTTLRSRKLGGSIAARLPSGRRARTQTTNVNVISSTIVHLEHDSTPIVDAQGPAPSVLPVRGISETLVTDVPLSGPLSPRPGQSSPKQMMPSVQMVPIGRTVQVDLASNRSAPKQDDFDEVDDEELTKI